ILSLLDELHLNPTEVNARDIDQLRARIRSGLTELVGELTVGGGPRVRRVDDIFTLLLERMSQLQDFLPDEGDATHFPAIADQMASVYRSWNNMQQLFGVQTTIVAKQLGL